MAREENGATGPGAGSPGDRLDSWKEIAAYLKRDVTTVQRWERREGMPVRRHLHDKLGSVYAYRADLDAWARSRNLRLEPESDERPPMTPPPAGPRRRPSKLLWGTLVGVTILALAASGAWLLRGTDERGAAERIAGAEYQLVTDFDGTEQAAAISRDGKLVAFLSARDGQPDVWVTQVGTGQFYNLTRGRFPGLTNPSVRSLGFSPDGSLVTFWMRRPDEANGKDVGVGIWAVPTLGGEPRPYMEGIAELDWTGDGRRLVYHTPAAGDPMFVREVGEAATTRPVYAAQAGVHAHFVLWSRDQRHIYFIQGTVPDAMDVWRIRSDGSSPERLTHHNSRVTYPVWLDDRRLLYLATDNDEGGPWLHVLDVERRVTERVRRGVERYASLAGSADGRRLVATLARPKRTFWRLRLDVSKDAPAVMSDLAQATRISLPTARAFAPRLGSGYLLYAASRDGGDSIWRLAGDAVTELCSLPGARLVGGPAISPDGGQVAFSVRRGRQTALHVMNADGTGARVVAHSLALSGGPAWAPDGRRITVAAEEGGIPRLFAVTLDGKAPVRLTTDYAVDPAWSPDGALIVYSGPDVGTSFALRAVNGTGGREALPNVMLTRGARRIRFLAGRRAIVLRGDIRHKDLWVVDLETGAERAVANLPQDFSVGDFDVSPDGREIVVERVQEQSDVVLLQLPDLR